MRDRDYIAKMNRRIKRFEDEADARIRRTIQVTIHRLQRELLEYTLRKQRSQQSKTGGKRKRKRRP